MTVSIVIPAYNAAGTIGTVLTALTQQDYSDFDIVIVDDASSDDTAGIAESFRERLALTVIRPEENLGRARARNFGVRMSTGELIVLLDSDIEAIPSYVARHVALHEMTDRAVGVGALRYPDTLAHKALAIYYASRGGARLKPGETFPGKAFVSCLASFPRSLFEEVGGFHESFRVYGGEDLELGLKFQKRGAVLTYLPEAIGYHHHLRSVHEVLETLQSYGQQGIPQVLDLHPDFAEEMLLDDLYNQDTSFSRLFRSVFTSSPFYQSAATLVSLLQNRRLPAFLITYLIYGSYRKGYRKYLRSTSRNNSPKVFP